MGEVVELKKGKRFTLKEARQLLPIVKRVTDEAISQIDELKKRIEELDPEPVQRPYYEKKFNDVVLRWSEKILKLGCEPKGLWLVDFDNGAGYYCWHSPEDDVEFYHSYEEGFNARTPIL